MHSAYFWLWIIIFILLIVVIVLAAYVCSKTNNIENELKNKPCNRGHKSSMSLSKSCSSFTRRSKSTSDLTTKCSYKYGTKSADCESSKFSKSSKSSKSSKCSSCGTSLSNCSCSQIGKTKFSMSCD